MTNCRLIEFPSRFVAKTNALFANTVPASQGTMEGLVNSSSKPLPGVSIIEFIEVVAFPSEALVGNPARPIRVPNIERLKGSSTSMQDSVGDPIKAYSVASADNVSDSALSISTSEENNNPFLPESSGVDRGFNVAPFENQNDIPVVDSANKVMDSSSSYPDESGENSNDIPVANSVNEVMDFSSSYPDESGEDSNDIPVANSADEVMDFSSSYPDEDTISVNSERFKGLSDDMGASVTDGVERALNKLIASTRRDSAATENPITSDADRSVGLADRDTVLVAPDVERVDGNQQTVDANKSGAVVLDFDFASLRTNLKAAQDALQESRKALEQARNAGNNQRRVYEQSLGVAARRLEAMKQQKKKYQEAAEKCREETRELTKKVDELDEMFYKPLDFDMNDGYSYSKAA